VALKNVGPEQAPDSGRKGYREPDEPPDGRLRIARDAFWSDPSEQMTYEHAVASNPRHPGEHSLAYIQRIASIVEHRYALAAKPMPGRMSQRERDARLAKLRREALAVGHE
jgi:hypothetical protein